MTQSDPKMVDLRGFQCPLPVLKTRHHMRKMQPGDRVIILTDDPLAAIDIPNFCNEHDQELVSQEQWENDAIRFELERRGAL